MSLIIRFFILAILGIGCHQSYIKGLQYPVTKTNTDITDTYFTTTVSDPYRWLEDDNSVETATWVSVQNKITFDYLENIPQKNKIESRLIEIWDYEKISAPFKRGGKYYYFKNEGLQNQSVLYSAKKLGGVEKIILDPNTFSEDGTIALSGTYFNRKGNLIGYAKSKGGSDWKEFYIHDTETNKDLEDHLKWIKFSGMSWAGEGFYYSRFPEPDGGGELDDTNENAKVYYHKLGTNQQEDHLIFSDPDNPRISNYISTTDDENYLILYRTKGTSGTALYMTHVSEGKHEFHPVIDNYEYDHNISGNIGNTFYLHTNYNAKNWRLVKFEYNNPDPENWIDVIPESKHPLNSVSIVDGKLLVKYSKDVSSRLYVYNLDGKIETEVTLPTIGTAYGFGGKMEDTEVFFTFRSFAYPTTVFRYNIRKNISTLYRQPKIDIDFSKYETKQIFYSSKDGTKIPMFITHKKDMIYDGTAHTLLYAYGGFNISINPHFSISRMLLIESGGIYATANIRGGGEYGESWHEDGMLTYKQNVFDDFIAAADYLVAENYTRREKLAIQGGSNGGLLIGAVINQRPDLCSVALPAVGVMDMLRYPKFTIGWAWATEYGDPEASEEFFQYIYAYSPLHNIQKNGNYPAVMVTTADHDDRVVPAHSFKYIATLQAMNMENKNPLLIRIETDAGHGAGMPTSKRIQKTADIWAFMFHNLGIGYTEP